MEHKTKPNHYFDSFCGLIPCQLVTRGDISSTVKLTASRPNYKRGEQIEVLNTHLVERSRVYVRDGQYRIY